MVITLKGGQIQAHNISRRAWKIPLRLKGSSWCGVLTENYGGLQRPPVVVGGGEEAWDVGNDFGRKKEKEMVVFRLLCVWPFPFLFLFDARRASHRRTGFWLAIKGGRPFQVVVSFPFCLFIW